MLGRRSRRAFRLVRVPTDLGCLAVLTGKRSSKGLARGRAHACTRAREGLWGRHSGKTSGRAAFPQARGLFAVLTRVFPGRGRR